MTKSKTKPGKTYAITAGIIYLIEEIYMVAFWCLNPDPYNWKALSITIAITTAINCISFFCMAIALFFQNKKAVVFAAGLNALFYGAILFIFTIFFFLKDDLSYSDETFWLFSNFFDNIDNIDILYYLCNVFAYSALIVISVTATKRSQTIKNLLLIPISLPLLASLIFSRLRFYVFDIFVLLVLLLKLAESIAIILAGLWLKLVSFTVKEDVVNGNLAFNATSAPYNSITTGGTDKIMMYKELLDNGTITQEEFDIKKKEILGN